MSEHPVLPTAVPIRSVAQVVGRMPLRQAVKVSAISPQGQPLVQLMLPAAQELAAKAPGRTDVGAPRLARHTAHRLF